MTTGSATNKTNDDKQAATGSPTTAMTAAPTMRLHVRALGRDEAESIREAEYVRCISGTTPDYLLCIEDGDGHLCEVDIDLAAQGWQHTCDCLLSDINWHQRKIDRLRSALAAIEYLPAEQWPAADECERQRLIHVVANSGYMRCEAGPRLLREHLASLTLAQLRTQRELADNYREHFPF